MSARAQRVESIALLNQSEREDHLMTAAAALLDAHNILYVVWGTMLLLFHKVPAIIQASQEQSFSLQPPT